MKKNNSSILNIIFLQLKTVVASPLFIIFISLFPVCLLFLVGTMVPDHVLFVPVYALSMILLTLIIFGNLYYPFKNSTFKNNILLLGYGELKFLVALFFTIVIFLTFSSTILTICFAIFETIDIQGKLFMNHWGFQEDNIYSNIDIVWKNISYITIYYFVIMTIAISFLISVVLRNFLKTKKSFSLFIIIYFLVILLFGSVLVVVFNVYDTKIGEFGSIDALYGDAETILPLDDWHTYLGFIIPQKFLNEHFTTVLNQGSIPMWDANDINANPDNIILNIPVDVSFFQWNNEFIYWNLTLLLPPAYCLFYLLIALLF